MSRLEEKLHELARLVQEFEEIKPQSFENYQNDKKEKAACERYFERIVECLQSIAFILIKTKKLPRQMMTSTHLIFLRKKV